MIPQCVTCLNEATVRFIQELLVKRGNEQEHQEEEEVEEEEMDDNLTERIEEARGVLEKLEEIRRDAKDGRPTDPFETVDLHPSPLARLDDEMLTQIFKLKLMSSPCQNQGYVLDGYPKTFDQAVSLFGGKCEQLSSLLVQPTISSLV